MPLGVATSDVMNVMASSTTYVPERPQASNFCYHQVQGGYIIIQNPNTTSSGPSAFDNDQQNTSIFTTPNNSFRSSNVVTDENFQQMDPINHYAPEPVMIREFEHSPSVQQNLTNFSSGTSIFDRVQEQFSQPTSTNNPIGLNKTVPIENSQPIDRDSSLINPSISERVPVVNEQFEQSSCVILSPPAASNGHEESYDIFQDVKTQIIALDRPRVVAAEIDFTKEKGDSDDYFDDDTKEETQEELDEEGDFSDAAAHVDLKDNTYSSKGFASKKNLPLGKVCQEVFSDASSLRRHPRIYDVRPYHCDVCRKHFRTKTELTVHFRVHTGERPYSCETCGKCFKQRSGLDYHIRIHTGEKKHQCDVCEKQFRIAGALKDHMLTHTGEKPYECKDCEKRYTRMSDLKRHRIRFHP